MKRKITLMIPFLFIIFSFIASGYLGLLFFLFPIVIVPVVQVVGLIRRWTQYSQSKTHGQKQGTTALVEDKLTITPIAAVIKATCAPVGALSPCHLVFMMSFIPEIRL